MSLKADGGLGPFLPEAEDVRRSTTTLSEGVVNCISEV